MTPPEDLIIYDKTSRIFRTGPLYSNPLKLREVFKIRLLTTHLTFGISLLLPLLGVSLLLHIRRSHIKSITLLGWRVDSSVNDHPKNGWLEFSAIG
jgi:hypothetical protein